jgi:hypothetical protein
MTQSLRRGEPYRPKKRIGFKLTVVSLLNRLPPLKKLLQYISKNISTLRYRWRARRLATALSDDFDVDKIYWVEPERIRYSSLLEFNIYKDKGQAIGGDWDRLEKQFEHLDVYIAFRERFMEGEDWEDTFFYQQTLDDIANGRFLVGCKSKADFDKRCEDFDVLFQNIKNVGYKPQSEVLFEENTRNLMQLEDEITVNVGRNGDLIFNNGAHRLAIAKLLGVQKIPIKITVRHPQWVDFRRQILLYAKDQPSGKIYQPLTHPDLQDLPSFHDTESNRFDLIRKNLSVTKGNLLDIGAHWGYFCHKFEEMGFDCYAVESEGLHVYFLRKLKRAENRHFKVIPKSIFEYRDIENLYFEVVLALNIFHHFLKDRASYFELLNLLGKLKLKEMYFQPHRPDEPQMEDAYKNYSEEEFVKFVLEASRLTEAEFIGATRDGRKIYKLY